MLHFTLDPDTGVERVMVLWANLLSTHLVLFNQNMPIYFLRGVRGQTLKSNFLPFIFDLVKKIVFFCNLIPFIIFLLDSITFLSKIRFKLSPPRENETLATADRVIEICLVSSNK